MTYEEWLLDWKTSKSGAPYLWEPARSMGIKCNYKGHHFWINEPIFYLQQRFTWSEGYSTEQEALRMLYEFLFEEHPKALVITSMQYGQKTSKGSEIEWLTAVP